MTEITDTLVVVVSEETGQISTAKNGFLAQNLSVKELRFTINNYLFEDGGATEESRIEQLAKSQKIDAPDPLLKETTS